VQQHAAVQRSHCQGLCVLQFPSFDFALCFALALALFSLPCLSSSSTSHNLLLQIESGKWKGYFGLRNLTITPIQRIPRYRMLLAEMLKVGIVMALFFALSSTPLLPFLYFLSALLSLLRSC
jgi:hypothetical protein